MILKHPDIPYGELTVDLFGERSGQKTIPFLGAGVSTSARPARHMSASLPVRQDPRIAEALERLTRPGSDYPSENGSDRPTLDSATRLYAEIALETAFLMQGIRDAANVDETELLQRLREDPFPPSGSDLVEWLSTSVAFGSFEDVLQRVSTRLNRDLTDDYRRSLLTLLRSLAGIAGVAPAPLSAASAFFEAVRHRNTLLDRLGEILQNKQEPTPTHRVLARAAGWHVAPERRRRGRALEPGRGHYLIMTTNYDCLMEQALRVPYVVLTLGLRDSMVRARFGNMPEELRRAFDEANPPRTPRSFSLDQPSPGAPSVPPGGVRLAIVYKVHGCITDWTDEHVRRDSIVISDNDYVTNISRFSDNDGVIPACVCDILSSTERPYFLFMGYSLRDWNVRGMLRAVRTKRAGAGREDEDYGDHAVVRNFGRLEQAFFLQHRIRIINEDLTTFSAHVEREATEQYGG